MIRPVSSADIPALCAIYNYYIEHSTATFEEEPVAAADMEQRVFSVTRDFPWDVFETAEGIAAFAYLHAYHARSAYRFTAEDSVYVKNGSGGKGIGKQLLSRLLLDAKQLGMHRVIALLGLPNAASEALHRSCGFEKMADMDELGYKFGRWAGVGYWLKRL
jgi:phosphinothricin acetyltransferase